MQSINSITDLFRFLGKKSEVEFEKIKFKGKAAGISWKYSNALDKIVAIRLIIFLMSIVVLYRIYIGYIFHGVFEREIMVERMIFSIFYLISGSLFNKTRKLSLVLALAPTLLISFSWLTDPISRPFAFQIAISLILLSGFYFDHLLKKYRKELEQNMS